MQLTSNSRAFIEAEQYSAFILENLHDGLLPSDFYRNVGDFAAGDTLHIKTVGTVTIQEAAEDTPLVYNPIESGEITLQITDYKGDAWYVTDVLRQDGSQVDQLMASRSMESTRAIQENFETRFLETAAAGQVDGDPNEINGFAHRIASSETNGTFQISSLVALKLAFDKANVPSRGRVLIVDPIVEATINSGVTITTDLTDYARRILDSGMSDGMRFVYNLFGFDIIVCNRLPRGEFSDGTTTITDGVANIAMCVESDQTKPVMAVWRQQPAAEGERNKDRARDEFVVRCRYGMGVQRTDTLGVIITSATEYLPA